MVVRAPASSANLGPGFDCLAVALDLWLEVEVEKTGTFSLETELDVPEDRSNLLVRAFERIEPADEYSFKVKSEIPLSGGLGSSAAATLAGLVAADTLSPDSEIRDCVQLACEIEGHPDNVMAAQYGGFVLCGAERLVTAVAVPADIDFILVVPHTSVSTTEARAVLPSYVPLEDAVFNVQTASRLVLALERGDLSLIGASLEDRLHQTFRSTLFPRSGALLEEVRGLGALGATISGAGPTVLVWVKSDMRDAVLSELASHAGSWAETLAAKVSKDSAHVVAN